MVTDAIIARLSHGVVPWKKPWNAEAPKNLISRLDYRGVNAILLSSEPYGSPYWVTYHQAQQLGGYVKRGEFSLPVVFWKWIPKKDEEELREYPLLRYYRVFNTEQCAGLESRIPTREVFDFNPLDMAERVVRNMPDPPTIRHEGQQAYYSALVDLVTMPSKDRFHNAEGYYSTLFHELTHSTGHPSRLNRLCEPGRQPSNRGDYSKEELVAEMGASFLCDHCRIGPTTIDNSTAYIDGWLQSLQNDPHMVVYAGAKAQRAADYILELRAPNSSPGT